MSQCSKPRLPWSVTSSTTFSAGKVGDQELVKFRVASNSRRRTADGGWEPGNSLFITVNCWGRLVTGVGAALGKGAPVIVVGHVYTSEYEDRDGIRRSSLEMRATSVGPDLSRVIVRIEKPGYTGPNVDPGTPVTGPAAEAAGQGPEAGVDTGAGRQRPGPVRRRHHGQRRTASLGLVHLGGA